MRVPGDDLAPVHAVSVNRSRPLLSVSDLAALLNLPVATIYQRRYVGADLPPALRIGRHLRWRQEAVEAWLIEQEHADQVTG